MEQQKIETLSVKQAVDELRALGIKTSPDKIRAGILQGAFPFGVCIKMENFECEITLIEVLYLPFFLHLFQKK